MKSAKINVMLGLLAVLFISLGYLTMQKKEGFELSLIKNTSVGDDKPEPKKKKKKDSDEDE